MKRFRAPFLRGLTVLAIGATLAVSHTAFAGPGVNKEADGAKLRVAVASQESDSDGQLTETMTMQENCYFDIRTERTTKGKIVSTLVQECD